MLYFLSPLWLEHTALTRQNKDFLSMPSCLV